MRLTIDLNSDLGEGSSYDAEIMTIISSCNIACGGHTGNIKSMQESMELAIENHLKVGAHPSYQDPENFGRKSVSISAAKLYTDLAFQLENFHNLAEKNRLKANHWKPHGALYNDLFWNAEKAEILIELMYDFGFSGELYVAPNSKIKELALAEGFAIATEAFADRNYQDDLQLVDRSHPNAVLSDQEKITKRLVQMILTKEVKSLNGKIINFDFQTVCLHSDTPRALEIAKRIKEVFIENQIHIE